MFKKSKLYSFKIILITIAMGCVLITSCKTHVEITEDSDGDWRIYDKNGNNRGTMVVKPGREVEWDVSGSDMVFFLPRSLNEYFTYEEGYFTESDTLYNGVDGPREIRRIQTISENNSLVLKVRREAPQDTIDYDIYVIDAEKYVIGNSPPYLIIRRSHN